VSAVLDTHTIIWYLENSAELSRTAREKIEGTIAGGQSVYISAISLIEAVYLTERGKLTVTALERLQLALRNPASGLLVSPIDMEVTAALQKVPRNLVPEMPDRIIAATALYLGIPLITRDRRLQSAGLPAIW
jgi:PIN domain nuclease of toxin-antitoxin system